MNNNMSKKTSIAFFGLVLATLLFPAISFAGEAPQQVVETIWIDPTGASEPYPPLFDQFTKVYKDKGSAGERTLWFSGHAGERTGMMVVSIMYPSMAAFAADSGLVQTAEYQALAQEFQQKGFRVTSRSLSYRVR